jgi:hypothetical protein
LRKEFIEQSFYNYKKGEILMNEENRMNPEGQGAEEEVLQNNPLYFNRKQAILGGLAALAIAILGFTGGYLYKKAQYNKAERQAENVGTPSFEGVPEELL